jgi:ATP-binding cassette subfamily B protein
MGIVPLLRGVLTYARPYTLRSLAILGLIVVQVAYALAIPLSFKVIFDEAIPNRDLRFLGWIAAAFAVALVILSVAGVLQDRLASHLGTRVMNQIRGRMFDQVQRLSTTFYAGREAGDLVSRFSSDLTLVEASAVRPLPAIVLHVLNLVLTVLLLVWVEWRLALLTFAALPVAFIAPKLFGARASESTRERKEEEARLTGIVQESVGIHAVVRAFALQKTRLGLFLERVGSLTRASDAATFWGALVGRGASLGVEFVQLLIVAVGAWLVIRGFFSAGSLVAFVGLLLNMGSAASALAQLVPPMIQATGGMRRIEELIAEPTIVDPPDAVPLPRLAESIRFEHVSLAYGARPILQDVSFTIRAGDSVAFVGPSGSGKSTVLSVLMRFQDPSAGRVLLDGVDLRQATEASLRAQVAIVLQDTSLFNTTVRENIRLGRVEAGDAEVEDAARSAQIHDLILGLERGYDTVVGERGGNLSGGQRQRVALARAILRHPAVLVLDEATSALDPVTAAAINATLDELARGRTCVTVTHRLASVVRMNRIFLLDGGRLVEEGTHEELLARRGLYRELWQKQSGFTLSEDGAEAEIDPARLKTIPMLSALEGELLEELPQWFGTERLPEGRTVFAQGDVGDKLFIVVRGAVDVLRADSRGNQTAVGVLETGDHFGELALLDDAPRNATLRTRVPCVFLTLSRQHFNRLLGEAPQVREAIEKVAAARRSAPAH